MDKFYKIVNPEGNHGLVYHEGINIDPLRFNPSSIWDGGGIYFAREDILAYLRCGTDLYEVEPIGDEVYESPSKYDWPKNWKVHQLNMKYIGKVLDNIPFLIEQGANVHADKDYPVFWAAMKGYLDIVKYLVEHDADIHTCSDSVLRVASQNGHLDVVEYLKSIA